MIGTTLNQYKITTAARRGRDGEVFRAQDMRLNRDVAVKMPPRKFAADTNRLRHFEP